VKAVDTAEKRITVDVRGRTMTVDASSDKVGFRRYAPDSIHFADAKPSEFAAIKVGDQLRALGDKDAEGTKIKGEEILFGTFRNIAAQIVSIDPATNEIKVTDLDAKKPLVIVVAPDSNMRKMPEMMAQMMAARNQRLQAGGGTPGGAGVGPAAQGGAAR